MPSLHRGSWPLCLAAAAALLVVGAVPWSASAQTPQAPPAAPSTPAAPAATQPSRSTAQLEQLAAPIALYPDSLLSQVLMASTYPLEVVEAARWSKANPDLSGQPLADAMQKQDWDPSVKSLTSVPQTLQMMSDKLDWTQELGNAFLAQPNDVLDAVQRLRARADTAGYLKTSNEQKVTKTPAPAVTQSSGQPRSSPAPTTIYAIESATPEEYYVPVYDPGVVYGTWPYPDYAPYYWYPPGYAARGAFWFAAGALTGAAIWGGINWGRNNIDIDVNRFNQFNRTNIANRNWNHNPAHRGGVPYGDRGVADRFGDQGRATAREGARNTATDRGERARQGAGSRPGGGDRPGAGNRPGGGDRVGAGQRPGGGDRVGAGDRPGGGAAAKAKAGGGGKAAAARGGAAKQARTGQGAGSRQGGAARQGAAPRPSARPSGPSRASIGASSRGGGSFGAARGGGARMTAGGGGGRAGGGGRGGGGRRSDIRLKHDIALLGHLDGGLGFYRFSYGGSSEAFVGVIAQEVQAVRPEAVLRGRDGYLRVRYDRLGLQLQRYNDWVASGARVPATTWAAKAVR